MLADYGNTTFRTAITTSERVAVTFTLRFLAMKLAVPPVEESVCYSLVPWHVFAGSNPNYPNAVIHFILFFQFLLLFKLFSFLIQNKSKTMDR